MPTAARALQISDGVASFDEGTFSDGQRTRTRLHKGRPRRPRCLFRTRAADGRMQGRAGPHFIAAVTQSQLDRNLAPPLNAPFRSCPQS